MPVKLNCKEDLFSQIDKLYCIFSLIIILQNFSDQILELDIVDHLNGDVFGLFVPGPHLQDGGEV